MTPSAARRRAADVLRAARDHGAVTVLRGVDGRVHLVPGAAPELVGVYDRRAVQDHVAADLTCGTAARGRRSR